MCTRSQTLLNAVVTIFFETSINEGRHEKLCDAVAGTIILDEQCEIQRV